MSGIINSLYTKIEIDKKGFMMLTIRQQVPPTLLFEQINSKIGLW